MSGNIVPRSDLQGNLGTGAKRWKSVYAKSAPLFYDTKALMIADVNLTPGLTAVIKGDTVVNDGTLIYYHIRIADQDDVYDDTSLILLSNGNVAEYMQSGSTYEGQQEIVEAIENVGVNVMANSTLTLPNIRAMKAVDLVEGTTVLVKGVSAVNDGNAIFYNVRAARAGETYDNINTVLLDNGNVAEILNMSSKISKIDFPVGYEYFSFNPNIPQGSLPLFGGEYDRATYSDLWAWVQTQTGYLKTEAEWQTLSTANNGNVPFYSSGDGSTTFRVPSLKCWVKGANGIVSEVGSYLEAGLPNITGIAHFGNIDGVCYGINTHDTSGAFYTPQIGNAVVGTIRDPWHENMNFGLSIDASRSSAIYGNSATVQPESIIGMWLVKAYGTIVDTGSIDEQQYIDEKFAQSKAYTDSRTTAGSLRLFTGSTLPEGWLFCDGSAISRSDYADLFNAIGTKYGVGDGNITFNIPRYISYDAYKFYDFQPQDRYGWITAVGSGGWVTAWGYWLIKANEVSVRIPLPDWPISTCFAAFATPVSGGTGSEGAFTCLFSITLNGQGLWINGRDVNYLVMDYEVGLNFCCKWFSQELYDNAAKYIIKY